MIIIIGILLAIAIPSYLKFRDRANKSAAQANVRASIPAVEAYYADNNTYAGATLSYLQSTYDQGVKNIVIQSVSSTTYCIQSTVGAESVEEDRPGCRHRDRRLPVNERDHLYDRKGRESAPSPIRGLSARALADECLATELIRTKEQQNACKT